MDNVACSGTESTLVSCSHTTSHNCGHNDDAGVQCQTCGLSTFYVLTHFFLMVFLR